MDNPARASIMDKDTAPNGKTILFMRSLREQVYEHLRGEIQAGRLAPGSFIKLDRISNQLGISRTPLRDAIIQLECEGFVTVLPRRGVMVNRLDLDTIKNQFEFVGMLESGVIRNVFHLITNDHIAEMAALNHQMRVLIRNTPFNTFDPQFYRLNVAFHNVFLELSDNSLLKQMVLRIKRQLYDFPRPPYMREWESIKCDEHDQLIEYFRNGAQDEAARLWRERHWGFEAHRDYIIQFYSCRKQEIQNKLDELN